MSCIEVNTNYIANVRTEMVYRYECDRCKKIIDYTEFHNLVMDEKTTWEEKNIQLCDECFKKTFEFLRKERHKPAKATA